MGVLELLQLQVCEAASPAAAMPAVAGPRSHFVLWLDSKRNAVLRRKDRLMPCRPRQQNEHSGRCQSDFERGLGECCPVGVYDK